MKRLDRARLAAVCDAWRDFYQNAGDIDRGYELDWTSLAIGFLAGQGIELTDLDPAFEDNGLAAFADYLATGDVAGALAWFDHQVTP